MPRACRQESSMQRAAWIDGAEENNADGNNLQRASTGQTSGDGMVYSNTVNTLDRAFSSVDNALLPRTRHRLLYVR